MSRASSAHPMSEVIIHAIRLAFPDSRAKRVARALGASFMTGRRIWGSGRVSQIYRRQLIETLDQELALNELAIRRLRRALRGVGDETSGAVAAASVGPVLALETGSSERTVPPSVNPRDRIGARGR